MLVVCALALIVAAGAFLVIGLAGGDVGDLYVSMALCVASLVVVAVSARLSRPRPARVGSTPPEPVAPDGDDDPEAAPASSPGPVAVVEDDPTAPLEERLARVTAAEEAELAARRSERVPPEVDDGDDDIWAAREPGRAAAAGSLDAPAVEPVPEPVVGPDPAKEAEPASEPVGGVSFPIADYDALEAEQVLPLVADLWPEEVPVVAARERRTKARPAVLDALASAAGEPRLAFPIAEYESLDTEQVTRLLDRLDASDLVTVQTAERAGQARVGVLVAVADALASQRQSVGAPRS